MTAQNASFWTRDVLDAVLGRDSVTCIYSRSPACSFALNSVLPSLLGAAWQAPGQRGKILVIARGGECRALEESLRRAGLDVRQLRAFKQISFADPEAIPTSPSPAATVVDARYVILVGTRQVDLAMMLQRFNNENNKKVDPRSFLMIANGDSDPMLINRLLHVASVRIECSFVEPPTRTLHGKLCISHHQPQSSSPSKSTTVLFRASDSALFLANQ